MRRAAVWSLPRVAARKIAGAWRAVVGLLLAAIGLLAVPGATVALMGEVATSVVQAPPDAAITAAPWVPTTRGSRVAQTSVTVEATRTGARVTVAHVIEVPPGDLLYDAARGDLIPEWAMVEAVIGLVEIRFGDDVSEPDYDRYQLDRSPGTLSRITIADTTSYAQAQVPTAAPQITLTPPTDRRAAATTSTVTVRGGGYAVDAVFTGEPETERTTETTFVDPTGPVEVRLFRTAAEATETAGRYADVMQPRVPTLFPATIEVRVLSILVPWLVLFVLLRPLSTHGGPTTVATWVLIAGVAVAGAGVLAWNATAAVAAPLLAAAWLGAHRSWTHRGVRRYLIAVATVTAVGAGLMVAALSPTPWLVLLAGCCLGALVTAPGLALLLGRRGWAAAGAVAGAAAVLAHVPAELEIGEVAFIMAAGLLWAPLLAPVWPRRFPAWIRWAIVATVAAFAFVTASVDGDALTWRLPVPDETGLFPWPIMARLVLVAVALHLLWKHLGPPTLPAGDESAVAVRRRYRAFVRAAAAQRDPLVLAAGVALVTAAFGMPSGVFDNAVIAYLAMPLAVLAVLRPARDGRVLRLARVTPRAFSRLLDTRAEARLAHRILDRLYHISPAHLASGDLSLDEFHRLKTEAVTGTRRGIVRNRALPVLASAAGRWAVHNGAAAALIVAGLAAPLMILEAAELFPGPFDRDIVYYVDVVRRLGRWAAYGFFFGCFYPSLRGDTPVAKALIVAAALVVPESLLTLFTSAAETPLGVLGATALRAAQVVAVMFLLGVIWEYRLARLARAPWTYIRDLRRMSALAAPLTAVAVAVASALIAVLVPELLGTAQPPPTGAAP
jgi:hypothetical protein